MVGFFGFGKSMLLNMIGCFDKLMSGEVLLEGVCMNKFSGIRLFEFCCDCIGFVF